MNAEVKKCADANDVKGLRYIFVDCLDVDPTFDTYREDFEYCRKLSGFLESYKELTPLRTKSSEWNEDYWVKLKVDLLKNFSETRFSHMIEVAKVIKADKIKRLQKERSLPKTAVPEKKQAAAASQRLAGEQQNRQSFDAEAQQRALLEAQRELELENQRTQAELERKERERAERAARLREEEALRNRQRTGANGSSSPKKAVGIAVLAAVILLVILLVFILR